MILKIILVLSGLVAVNSLKSYENFKVVDVVPKSEDDLNMLRGLQDIGYDFWTDITDVGGKVRILISPEDDYFTQLMEVNKVEVEVTIPNVQTLFDEQLKPSKSRLRNSHGSFSWDKYNDLDQINAYMDELATMYPDFVTISNVGRGTQGNLMKAAVIDLLNEKRTIKPLVAVIEGGTHAREWIAPATATWIMKEILTSTDPEMRGFAENFIWHIIPVANPDGYAYTFSNDRMWRKNRNPSYETVCTPSTGDRNASMGVDLNRNYNFKWMTTGADQNPCSNLYAGPGPESEPETQAISNYVAANTNGNLMYYIAFHSYSQLILVPYSHSQAESVLESGNYADMFEIAVRGADKLKERYGTEYSVGLSADLMYPMSGTSFDTMKAERQATLAYLFELRDKGTYGFALPADQIVSNNLEIMDALIEIDKTARMLGYYKRDPISTSSSSTFMLSTAAVIGSLMLLLLQ